MLINLTDIFTSEQKVEELTVTYEPDTFTVSSGTYEIVSKTPLFLRLENTGKGKAKVTGHMELTLSLVCDRCLKPVEALVKIQIEETISEEELAHPDDADEFFYIEDMKLDVEKLVSNEILINWPPKVLCRQDCKGICKICGKDLNLGECGCDDFVPDPRMAVIKDIFNAG